MPRHLCLPHFAAGWHLCRQLVQVQTGKKGHVNSLRIHSTLPSRVYQAKQVPDQVHTAKSVIY